jgi:hypothetical protein
MSKLLKAVDEAGRVHMIDRIESNGTLVPYCSFNYQWLEKVSLDARCDCEPCLDEFNKRFHTFERTSDSMTLIWTKGV